MAPPCRGRPPPPAGEEGGAPPPAPPPPRAARAPPTTPAAGRRRAAARRRTRQQDGGRTGSGGRPGARPNHRKRKWSGRAPSRACSPCEGGQRRGPPAKEAGGVGGGFIFVLGP